MAKTHEMTDTVGRKHTLRLVEQGDRYDEVISKIHKEDRPMVQFYLTTMGSERSPEGAHLGLFVAEMYLETVMDHYDFPEPFILDRNTGMGLNDEDLANLKPTLDEWSGQVATPTP